MNLAFIYFALNHTIVIRAVDNQVFIAMCSPARDLSADYHAVSISQL